MYLRMMKRDLKRKKAMNLILLIFVFLASAFIASSVGNILSITGAIDHFFEISQVPDSVLVTLGEDNGHKMDQILPQIPEIDSFEQEDLYALTQNNFSCQLEVGTLNVHAFEGAALNYYDGDNQKLESVEPGCFYLANPSAISLEVGQTMEITIGQNSVSLRYAGTYKDPVLNTRILVNQKDFDALSGSGQFCGTIYYLTTEDTGAVGKALDQSNADYLNYVSNEDLRMGFVMHMVLAGTLLVVSVFLMLISFVVLRFAINFSISEEYRQIGVMKAIGLHDRSIRRLFTAKYFAIAMIGAILGYFASLPLSKAMLKTVSTFIVMPTENLSLVGIACALAVLLLTVGFSYLSTRKIRKLTPLNAIRSGSSGERFRKKSFLHLHKANTRPSAFMAVNDMLSSPKRFLTLILVFSLCLSLVLILSMTTNTLRSSNLLDSFNWSYSHLFVADDRELLRIMSEDGRDYAGTTLHQLEAQLLEEGIPAQCVTEVSFTTTLQYGETTSKPIIFQGVGTTTTDYSYERGSAPSHEGEIALATRTAEELGVDIGDRIYIPSFEQNFLVTGIYQSMYNMGEGARVHESLDFSYGILSSIYDFQVLFTDDPDEDLVKERIDSVARIFKVERGDIQTADQYVDSMVGVADSIDGVQKLVLVLALVITILITLLMEHSFLTKERNEIALLKALGFRNSSLILWHSLRFAFTSLLATLISVALLHPLTKLSVDPVFSMMGAEFGVQYDIAPLDIYVVYPLLFLLITISTAALTAVQIREVKTSECTAAE